ncbi:MAG: Ig-like domain-containing protein, partial [Pseudohongiellaceae bacterium]
NRSRAALTELTINLASSFTGDLISGSLPTRITLAANASSTQFTIATDATGSAESGSLTMTLLGGIGYQVPRRETISGAATGSATVAIGGNPPTLPNLFLVIAGATAQFEGRPGPKVDFIVSVWGGHPTLGGGSPLAFREVEVILDYAESRRQCIDHIPPFPQEFEGGGNTPIPVEPRADRFYRGDCTITVTLVPTDQYNAPVSGIMSDGRIGSNSVTFTLLEDEVDLPENRAPQVSVSAPAFVTKGSDIPFTISTPVALFGGGTRIHLEFSSVGNLVSGTLPSTTFLPHGVTSATLNIPTNAAAAAESGSLTVTLLSGRDYDPSSTAGSASVTILSPSAKPTVTLASDTGSSADDNITNAIAPTFTLGNLRADATITVQAISPAGNSGFRKTLTVASGASSATIGFGSPGAGGNCETLDAQGMRTGSGTVCAFSDSLANQSYDGDWRITATQTESGNTRPITSSDTLTVTLDTTKPTITLTAGTTNLVAGGSTNITLSISEAINLPQHFFTGGIHGSQGSPLRVADTNDYTIAFTSVSTDTANTITFNVAANTFTDLAGNGNLVSNVLNIVVEAEDVLPTPSLRLVSDTGVSASDNITNVLEPEFSIGNLVVDTMVTILAIGPAERVSKTISVSAVSETVVFGTPGLGGLCKIGASQTTVSRCYFIEAATETSGNGDWNITATAIQGRNKGKDLTATSDTLTVVLDTVAPTISLAAGATSLTTGSATDITISVSEASNLSADKIRVTGGGGSLSDLVPVMDSTTDYTITFTAITTNEAARATIAVAARAFTDLAGNSNAVASNRVDIVIPDTVAPSITLGGGFSSAAEGAEPALTTDIGITTAITLAISEPASLTLDDISVSGGSLADFMPVAGSASDYTVAFTAAATATTASIFVAADAFTDPAGNGNEASNVLSIAVELPRSAKPTVDLAAASDLGFSDSDNISSDTMPSFILGNLVVGATVLVEALRPEGEIIIRKTLTAQGTSATAEFGRPGLGGNCDYIRVSDGVVVSGNTTSCSLKETLASPDGDWPITVTQTEPGGIKTTVPAEPLTLTIDTAYPVIDLFTGNTSLADGNVVTITVVVTEANDLALEDFTVTDGTLSDLRPVAGTGNYTITYTAARTTATNPLANTASIHVAEDAFTDLAGNGNEVSNRLMISVATSIPSAKPGLRLVSDTGASDSDGITSAIAPEFRLSNLVAAATVVVQATAPDNRRYRKTLVVEPAANSATVVFGSPGAGGDCEVFDARGMSLGSGSECAFSDGPGNHANDGDWTLVATQTESSFRNTPASSDSVTLTLDTRAPDITLATGALTLAIGDTTSITATVGEDSDLALEDFSVSGGVLSALTAADSARTYYRATFVAAASVTTASISVAANSFTDLAGHSNGEPSNVLSIPVLNIILSAKPSLALAQASDTGTSADDRITNDGSPAFILGNLVAGARVTIDARYPGGTDLVLRKTLLVAPGATGATIGFDSPGPGGRCDLISLATGSAIGRGLDSCQFAGDASNVGDWMVTATQLESDDIEYRASSSEPLTVRFDNVPPTITLAGPASLPVNVATRITLTTGEATNLALADISVSGGALAGLASVSDADGVVGYTATFTAGGNATTASLSVAANAFTDLAGNSNSAGNVLSIVIEALLPSAQPTLALAQASDTGSSSEDRITNDDSPGFTLGNLVSGATVVVEALHLLSNSGASSRVSKTLTASDSTATLAFDDAALAADGAWRITASQTESERHKPTASDPLGLILDRLPPTIISLASAASLVAGNTTVITIAISEASSLAADDISVSNGSLAALTPVTNPNSVDDYYRYTANFTTPITDTAITATISVAAGAFTDLAGNSNKDASSVLRIAIEAVALSAKPTLDLVAASDSGISPSDDITNMRAPVFSVGNLVVGASVTIEAGYPSGTDITLRKTLTARDSTAFVVFSDPGAGGSCDRLDAQGIILSAGDADCFLGGADDEDDGRWTITASQTEPGKPTTAADPLSVVRDTSPPGIALTAAATSLVAGSTSAIIATVSDANDTDFALSDISVSGGSLSEFTRIPDSIDAAAGATQYSITFIAAATASTASVSVAAGSFADSAGNSNEAPSNVLSIVLVETSFVQSAQPTLALASDSGSSSEDNITNAIAPTFTIGNLLADASVTVQATGPGGNGFRKTLTVPPGATATTMTTTATVTFGNPGAGGNCEAFDAMGVSTGSITECAFSGSPANGANDGDWQIIASQTESGINKLATVSDTLTVTLDTIGPGITLTGATSITAGTTTSITATVSDANGLGTDDLLTLADISASGGSLSAFAPLADAGDGARRYTISFSAADTASIRLQVAADAVADLAGNGSAASNALDIIVVAEAASLSQKPYVDMTAASDTGISDSDNLTNHGEFPEFVVSNLIVGATVVVHAHYPPHRGRFYRKTLSAGDTTATVSFARPGAGGNCDFIIINPGPDGGGNRTNSSLCFFSLGTGSLNDGDWRITATQTEPGKLPVVSEPLTMTLDTGQPSVGLAAAGFTSLTVGASPVALTATLAGGSSSAITVSVSEPTDIALAHISVSGGTLSAFTPVPGSATDYTMMFTAAFSASAITASISVAANAIHDPAGNNNRRASNVLSALVAASRSAQPSVDLISDLGASPTDNLTNAIAPVFSIGNLAVGASLAIRATGPAGGLGKTITATGPSAVVVFGNPGTGGNCETFDAMGVSTGISDMCFFGSESTHDNDGDWTIAATQTERDRLPGNPGSLTIRLDTRPPTISLAAAGFSSSVTVSSLAAGAATTITVAISEATDFAGDDISVSGGVLSGFAPVADSDNYTVTFTADRTAIAITATVSVAADLFSDRAGNSNSEASNVLRFTVGDIVMSAKPSLTLASDSGASASDNLTNDASPTFTLTGLVVDATVVVDARVLAGSGLALRKRLTATGVTASVEFADSGGLCDHIDVASGAVVEQGSSDCALSAGDWRITASQTESGVQYSATDADPLTITIDTDEPTITLAAAASTITAGAATTITVAVSEASDFAEEDISVSGGRLSGFAQVANSNDYTMTFTTVRRNTSLTASISVAANRFTDRAGNGNAASD